MQVSNADFWGSRCRPAGWLATWRASLLASWTAGWLAGWLAGQLAGWPPGGPACWPAGWLAGWLAGQLAGWYPVQDDSRRKNSLCNVGCCARTLNCLAIVKRNLLRAIPSWAKSHLENLYVLMKIRKSPNWALKRNWHYGTPPPLGETALDSLIFFIEK